MPPNVTPGYLKYLQGAAEDRLNAAFPDEQEVTRAYRSKLRHVIEVYGGVREQLGDECADLVAELPYEGTYGLEDAQIALAILRATAAELQDLLDEDDELKKKAAGEPLTDDDADAQIRADAAEWSKRHNVDQEKLSAYDRSAKSLPSGVDDAGTRDSFYRGNAKTIESDIRDSAREDKKPPKTVTVKVVSEPTPPAAEKQPTTAAVPNLTPNAATPTVAQTPSAEPILPPPPRPAEEIEITAADFSLMDPAQAFKSAMQWLGEHIALVTAGSRRAGSFPRIAPLTALSTRLPEQAPTEQAVADLIKAMRRRFEKLRAPTGGDIGDIAMRLKDIDPKDPKAGMDVLQDLLREMTGRKKEEGDGDWEKPWGEGGWQD
jgi:hypothetical protein